MGGVVASVVGLSKVKKGGLGGLVGGITGSTAAAEQQAAAAQGAALAEQRAREASATEQVGFRREAVGFAREAGQRGEATARDFASRLERASQSPQELRALEGSLSFQEKDIARSEKLLASIDPAILEASQQALKLLRGEEAGTTNVVRGQRDRQRKQLVDRLRGQLGPGAENSSAGIQALNQFDQQTSDLVAQNQQSSLGQLTQISQGFTGQRGDIASRGLQGLLSVSQGFGQRSQRQVGAVGLGGQLVQGAQQFGAGQQLSALQTGAANIGSARAGAAGVAGAGFVGQQLLGQQALGTSRAVTEGAFQLGGALLGRGGR